MKFSSALTTGVAAAALLGSSLAMAGGSYEVTITNLTRAQLFTPILVASHSRHVQMFQAGQAASAELAALAEGGATGPLGDVLAAQGASVNAAGDVLAPGASTTVTVAAHGRRISLAGMLLPTNDGFVALNSVRAPRHGSVSYTAVAYDAGSEPNDEMCANIPGPVCGGAGGSPEQGGEGHIHVHSGIHGIADLAASAYDWRNPVARVTIKRVQGH